MNAKERLKRIIRAQNSLLRAKNHLKLAQNSIRKEYNLCVQEAADADGFVADCDERIERASSWDGAQPDAYFGRSIKYRRCDSRDFGKLVRVSTQPVADPADMERAVLIGLDYGPDGDISGYQCEGSKGQAVHWLAAWTEMKPGEELVAPPNGRKFTRIHVEGVDFSTGSQPKDGSLWDVIAEKWQVKPLDLVYLVPPAKWAQWPTWSTLHDLVLRNHRFVIDPEAEAKVSETGEIAIKVLGLWVNVEWLHVDHSFRAKAAQLLAKDYHWEPTTFGEAMLANRPPAEPAKEAELDGLPDIRTFAQPNLRWRILEPGEEVCSGDWVNAKSNPPSDPPHGLGWRPSIISAGLTVLKSDGCIYARLVADEPAKEPVDHLAVPMISPGEWLDIRDAYRDATPADVGKLVYVRNGELEPWIELRLAEVTGADFPYRCPSRWQAFRYACIRNEKPASSPIGEGYRHPKHADIGKQCEFSDGSTNPDGSLVWGIFARLISYTIDSARLVTKYYTDQGSYYDCRVKVEG